MGSGTVKRESGIAAGLVSLCPWSEIDDLLEKSPVASHHVRMKPDHEMRENADLPKWQARSLFFVVMLMTAPVFVLAFLVMYGGSEDAGGLPIWVIGAIVVWALSADHLLSWGADRFGLLGGMAKRPRERLFHALALAPLFAMIFVDGARQSLSPALAWVLGIAFIVFVMMTAPTLFGWVWQRVRSRLG